MTMGNEWQDALAYIEGKVPKQVYDTWFTPIHFERIDDSSAQLGVPNKFFGDWLSQHYRPLLAEAISTARGGEETANGALPRIVTQCSQPGGEIERCTKKGKS